MRHISKDVRDRTSAGPFFGRSMISQHSNQFCRLLRGLLGCDVALASPLQCSSSSNLVPDLFLCFQQIQRTLFVCFATQNLTARPIFRQIRYATVSVTLGPLSSLPVLPLCTFLKLPSYPRRVFCGTLYRLMLVQAPLYLPSP